LYVYFVIIIIPLLATSFGLKKPTSGQYLQKSVKMQVHIVQKCQLYGIPLTFVSGLISGYYQLLDVPKLREYRVTQMLVSRLSGGMVTLVTKHWCESNAGVVSIRIRRISLRKNFHARSQKLRKANVSFVMSVCPSISPSVPPSVWNNSAPTGRI